jgi:hypothetical protein
LFKNIGHVLVSALDPALYEEIMTPVRSGEKSLHHSAVEQIGCSLVHFGSLVLQQWKMPDSIIQAAGLLPIGDIKKTKHRSDWVRQVAAFSSDASDVIMKNTQFTETKDQNPNFDNEKYTADLIRKYGGALELDAKVLAGWLSHAVAETEQLVQKLGMDPGAGVATDTPESSKSSETKRVANDVSLDGLMMSVAPAMEVENKARHPSGKPLNSRDLLLAGVSDMTQTIASGKFQLNALVLQLLEIVQGSLGFQFVTAALKDAKTDSYIARISLGQDWNKKQRNFVFPSKDATDLFHLALKNNVDLMISETGSQKVHHLRPEWHLTHFAEVKSLMILPLIVNTKPIGLIYADRNCEAPEGVPADETSLVKTMKAQLITVMSK